MSSTDNDILKALDFEPCLLCEVALGCTSDASLKFKMKCCGKIYLACTKHMVNSVNQTRNILARSGGVYCTNCDTVYTDEDPWFVTYMHE